VDGKLLHLGCGNKHLPGFINIDIQKLPEVDLVADITDLSFIPAESVDLIYACHVLEHIDKKQTVTVLKNWYRVLSYGGTLRVAVPDFAAITKWYRETGDIDSLVGLTIGGNKNDYDNHKALFDLKKLEDVMEEAGFSYIRKYDWRNTIHKDHDDFSQAYLPHMQKTGMLMSLNVEAIKAHRKGGIGAKLVHDNPILVGQRKENI
jgi:predicted SAM-dependent methyltransferase